MGDISYAFRSLRKSPLASLTIVVTVALGLGMVAAVFTFLNVFLFRADNVPNIHELFGVERPRTADGELVRLTRPVYDALRRETGVFTDVFAMVPETDSRVNGRTMGGSLVTGNFFQVLGVAAAQGRVLTPADDDERQPVVVLSDRGWATHFANDPAVLEPQLPDQRHPLRHRRRDAEGLSRADGRHARLLGAAVADRAAATRDGRRQEGNRRRHHRPVAAGPVARSGAGAADRLGFATHRRRCRAAHRRHHAGAATRHDSTTDGGGDDLYAALCIIWPHPADWLRECRQPPARARGVAPEGSRRSSLPWRVTRRRLCGSC